MATETVYLSTNHYVYRLGLVAVLCVCGVCLARIDCPTLAGIVLAGALWRAIRA